MLNTSADHASPARLSGAAIVALACLAMIAFAANSLLCRDALRNTGIDAASFTVWRLIAGAVTLLLISRVKVKTIASAGSWGSALSLFIYAGAFSYAYVSLPTGTGALLLFGAVQATMIGYGLQKGERFTLGQVAGLIISLVGLIALLMPGVSAPSLGGALTMATAGVAWAVYSIRGRGEKYALRATAGNFLRTLPLAFFLFLGTTPAMSFDLRGIALAVASGAFASGIGYAIWYSVLPRLRTSTAAAVQLSVPAIATVSGFLILDEILSFQSVASSVAILSGIMIFILAA